MNNIDLRAEVQSEKLREYWLKIKLLSYALIISSCIYGFVVLALDQSLFKNPLQVNMGETNNIVRLILFGSSIFIILLSFLIRKISIKKVVKGSSSKNILMIDSPLAANLTAYFYYKVSIMTMMDAVALHGLLFYFLFKDIKWCFVLIAIGLTLKLLHLPSRDRFITLMEKYRHKSKSHLGGDML